MTRLMVTGGFVVAFLAGLIVGLTRVTPQGAGSGGERERSRDRGSWLVEQLSLTPQQQEQMKAIWDEAAAGGYRKQRDQRRRMKEELDAAIVDLIREEDQSLYEQLLREHDARLAVMEAEWKRSFQNAIEQTKAILTPEQRVKYEAILTRQQWDGGSRERGDRGRGSTRPSSRPANGVE